MHFISVRKISMEIINFITVEVSYAIPSEQLILSLKIPEHYTVEKAIKNSGILKHFPQIIITADKCGIFGKICTLKTSLLHKDRIEIYRKLITDPKKSRRKQAEQQKQKMAKLK